MWFGVSVPLVFLGAYLGYKRPQVGYPTKTNLIPRAGATRHAIHLRIHLFSLN